MAWTELRTAGQSRVVMAVVHATVPHIGERAQGDRGALVEERQEAARSAAAVGIQSVCALNLQNARSRQNLTADGITTRRRNQRRCARRMTGTTRCAAGQTRHASGA